MRYYKTLLFVLLGIIVMTSCNSDDEDTNNSENSIAELIINNRSYGKLSYACFVNNGDGTGSFIFSNQNISSGLVDYDSNFTYLSIRVPFTSGDIPTGVFSGSNVDADFDVNRILSSETCDMTGWSTDLTLTVQTMGNKYNVSVKSDKLHIFHSNTETGSGTIGTLKMDYEGSISLMSIE